MRLGLVAGSRHWAVENRQPEAGLRGGFWTDGCGCKNGERVSSTRSSSAQATLCDRGELQTDGWSSLPSFLLEDKIDAFEASRRTVETGCCQGRS